MFENKIIWQPQWKQKNVNEKSVDSSCKSLLLEFPEGMNHSWIEFICKNLQDPEFECIGVKPLRVSNASDLMSHTFPKDGELIPFDKTFKILNENPS